MGQETLFISLSLSLSLFLSVCLVMCVCVCVSSFHFWCCLFLFFFSKVFTKCWVLQRNWHESQAKLSKCLWECSKTSQNIILNHVETALPGAEILFFFRSNFYIQPRVGCRSVESYPTWRCLLREAMFIYVWWIVSWQLFLFLSSCFRKNGGCWMICWKQLRTFRMHELSKPNVQSFQTLRLTEIQWVFDSPHLASFSDLHRQSPWATGARVAQAWWLKSSQIQLCPSYFQLLSPTNIKKSKACFMNLRRCWESESTVEHGKALRRYACVLLNWLCAGCFVPADEIRNDSCMHNVLWLLGKAMMVCMVLFSSHVQLRSYCLCFKCISQRYMW